MMKNFTIALLAVAAMLMFVNPLLAADDDFPKATYSDDVKQSARMRMQTSSQTLSAKQLMEMSVVNQQGEKIGEITDIRVDQDLGRIDYVIITRDDGSQVSLPLHALEIDGEGQQANLAVSQEKMETAPAQRDMSKEEYFYRLQGHYGIYPAWQIVPREQVMHDPPALAPNERVQQDRPGTELEQKK